MSHSYTEAPAERTDALASYRENKTVLGVRLLKVVHISDLHFAVHPILRRIHPKGLRGHNQDALDALLTIAKQLAPDLVFATGDHTTWGDRRSLKASYEFLQKLVRSLGLSKDRLFVIPGNHDVLLHYYRPFSGTRRNYDRVFGRPDPMRLLTIQGYKLAVFSFDSTIKREQKGILWPIKGSMGRISPRAFNEFNDACRKCDDLSDRVRVAQVHHHPLPIPHKRGGGVNVELTTMANGGTFLAHLQDSGIQLTLHGHEHIPYSCGYQFSTESPRLVVAAAGSACQVGCVGSFNFIQMFPRSRTIVTEYEYSEVGFRMRRDSVKVWLDNSTEA